MIKKLFKYIFVTLFIVIILVFAGTLIFLNSIEVNITDDDLPQEVYDTSSTNNMVMLGAMSNIVTSGNGDVNGYIETFINAMIYQTVLDDVNPFYDPINGEIPDSQFIIKNAFITIDYIYANITEDNQIKITVSMKRGSFPSVTTAMYLYFDMDYSPLLFKLTMSLNSVYMDDTEISQSIYNTILNQMDKESIENSVDKGTLDLDEYTYEISFLNYIIG